MPVGLRSSLCVKAEFLLSECAFVHQARNQTIHPHGNRATAPFRSTSDVLFAPPHRSCSACARSLRSSSHSSNLPSLLALVIFLLFLLGLEKSKHAVCTVAKVPTGEVGLRLSMMLPQGQDIGAIRFTRKAPLYTLDESL